MDNKNIIKFDPNLYSNDRRRKKRIRVIEFGKNGVPSVCMIAQLSKGYIKNNNTFSLTDEGVVLEITPIIENFRGMFASSKKYPERAYCNWGTAILFYNVESIDSIIEMLNTCKKKLIDDQLKKLAKEQIMLEMNNPDVKRYIELENQINSLNFSTR